MVTEGTDAMGCSKASGGGGGGGASAGAPSTYSSGPTSDFNWEAVRPKWSSYSDYREVVVEDRRYAEIAGRLYKEHAVARMAPPSTGMSAGTQTNNDNKTRGISPRLVEDVIRNGHSQPGNNTSYSTTWHTSGNVRVITSNNGRVVESVIIVR